MGAARATLLLWALGLAWASARAACSAPPRAKLAPRGPSLLVPDLARDGAERLAWLPGFGRGGAARLIASRARLGVPLDEATLALVPGIGPALRRDALAALARWRRLRDGAVEEEGQR